ncbi:unnamed protein product [Citrullus colocynthis]|uniref:Uncharacterized protein n=1 Tax=Citrullus colocynthis TaxID=252529 RepID=A0ABP0YDG9_9ROSI
MLITAVLKLITSTILNISSKFILVLSVFLLHITNVFKMPLRRLKSFDVHSLWSMVGRMDFLNGSDERPYTSWRSE